MGKKKITIRRLVCFMCGKHIEGESWVIKGVDNRIYCGKPCGLGEGEIVWRGEEEKIK